MKQLGSYNNGNYNVTIFDDGTKIRETKYDDEFVPKYPECMDLKITNKCDMGCPYCHEASTKDGKHGDILQHEFIDSLSPYIEVAIGGGNPLCHPDLIPFLELLKEKDIIANMTVNQKHFLEHISLLTKLCESELIRGLGVSYTKWNWRFLKAIQEFPNAVIHVINGVIDLLELGKLQDKDLKILILGYKEFRKGKEYYSPDIVKNMESLYRNLPEILKGFKVVSFDNLALEQLKVKRLLSEKQWDMFYMGDEGQFTMYIDAVNEKFAKNSTSEARFPLTKNIKTMFNVVKNI